MSAKIKKRIYYAILISLMVHMAFLVWSFFIRILPQPHAIETPQKLLHVRIAKNERVGQTSGDDSVTSEKALRPENPFTETAGVQPQDKDKESMRESLESMIKPEKLSASSLPPQPQVLKKPQLNESVTSKKVRRAVRKNLVEIGELPDIDFSSGSPVGSSGTEITESFLDKSSFIGKLTPNAAVAAPSGQNEFQVMKRTASGLSKKSTTADAGTTLAYELYKYQDPKTKEKYFKLLVKVRDVALHYPVIPKEVVFLVDTSNSIGGYRLEQFMQGVVHSLKHLNSEDRFNIIIFKEKTFQLSPQPLTSEPGNIKKAVEFLRELKSGSTTDVYNAMKVSLEQKSDFVPSYRMVLSDGFPTRGIIDSRQVINETADMNKGKISVFAFGGGVSLNKYMLEFLAYKNRGWAEFSDRDYFIGRDFSKLYDKIKDPLLLNLRYHTSGLNEKEVFPQVLPDFFKGSEFVIYGQYSDENKFVVQVLGDISGQTKEFMVTDALDQASPGNKEIARQWAFHKVYHLIGQIKHDRNNQGLINQIDELCARFGIVTPYSKTFRKN